MDTHRKRKVRKQFLLDPELLNAAKRDLKAKTDTEAVEKALWLATRNGRMWEAHRKFFNYQGEGDIEDVYGRLEPIER